MSSSTPPSHGATTPTQYTDKDEGGHYHCNHPHHHYEERNQNVQKPHQSMVSQVYDPSFFKVANPGPLGLISFALTTFVLGLYQCGAGLPGSNPFGGVGPDQAIFGLAVFFGGIAQFFAGLMEFRVGNTFGTTVHCSYGAFWLAFAMFFVPDLAIKDAYKGDDRAYSFALGILLILWCFLTLVFFIAALKTNIAILVVLGCLFLAFLFLSLAQFLQTSHPVAAIRINKTGGAFSVICAAAAFYAGAAGIMTEDTTWVRFPLGEIDVKPKKTSMA
ncbi:gpr1 family protein [Fusarium langsethiae]|uniref:Gpr1 family protein n=1 Tax=Fusarium langsethiae TaxID=179993 RepID=A0A0M9F3D3_FUSLA|nr:gpr1 family protein [Fusarium langsethiae]